MKPLIDYINEAYFQFDPFEQPDKPVVGGGITGCDLLTKAIIKKFDGIENIYTNNKLDLNFWVGQVLSGGGLKDPQGHIGIHVNIKVALNNFSMENVNGNERLTVLVKNFGKFYLSAPGDETSGWVWMSKK
jgi:hypothetical protein